MEFDQCPHCGSDNTSQEDYHFACPPAVIENMSCDDCNATWDQIYEPDRFENKSTGPEAPVEGEGENE